MERYYEIAGVIYCVKGTPDAMNWNDGVLAQFKTENNAYSVCIEINIKENLSTPSGECVFTDEHKKIFLSKDGTYIRYEGTAGDNIDTSYMRIERKEKNSYVEIKPLSLGAKSVLTSMELEHQSVENTGVLFHGACIVYKGKAIVFTAPSGVGKSTQAKLWCDNRGAVLINGDRCIIRKIDRDYFMCGVPYCGSSRVSINCTLPIEAVVYLTQSGVSVSQRTSGINSFMHIWEGCCINTWNNSDMDKSVEFVSRLSEHVPVFRLDCTPDITAVEALEMSLRS